MPINDYSGQQGFDFKDMTQPLILTKTSNVATVAGQTVSAFFDSVPFDFFWSIEQISVSNTSTTTTTGICYGNSPQLPSNIVASTLSGNLDQDDVNSPIIILGANIFSVAWTNCSVGAVGTVRIQVRAKQLIPYRG